VPVGDIEQRRQSVPTELAGFEIGAIVVNTRSVVPVTRARPGSNRRTRRPQNAITSILPPAPAPAAASWSNSVVMRKPLMTKKRSTPRKPAGVACRPPW
jgi:hypothetical protein